MFLFIIIQFKIESNSLYDLFDPWHLYKYVTLFPNNLDFFLGCPWYPFVFSQNSNQNDAINM